MRNESLSGKAEANRSLFSEQTQYCPVISQAGKTFGLSMSIEGEVLPLRSRHTQDRQVNNWWPSDFSVLQNQMVKPHATTPLSELACTSLSPFYRGLWNDFMCSATSTCTSPQGAGRDLRDWPALLWALTQTVSPLPQITTVLRYSLNPQHPGAANQRGATIHLITQICPKEPLSREHRLYCRVGRLPR